MRTQQDFDEAERNWRERLVGRSLVIEANADPAVASAAFRILGSNYQKSNTLARRRRLLDQYRAALAVGLCSVGSQGYSDRTFWPAVGDAFGQYLGGDDQREISEAFRAALDAFGLSRFTTPMRNVGEILMHAGVPIASLESFARALVSRDAKSPGLDGRLFRDWVTSMTQDLASSLGLDAPTWRFLTEAGEVAEDFVDRCLVVLDRGVGVSGPEASSDGLPAPVIAELSRLVASGALDRHPERSRARSREAVLYPRLQFSPGAGVRVQLPPLETVTESAISWRVAAEGKSTRIDVAAPWPGDLIKPLFTPISYPAKIVMVSVTPGDQSWDLDLVNVEDPLVIFDSESGYIIPSRTDLPKSSVWIMFANQNGAPLSECVESDGNIRIVAESDSPYGWAGWSFAEIDLSAVAKLRFVGSDRWRYTSSVTRPVISGLVNLPNLVTIDGRYVSSARPSVVLPSAKRLDGGTVSLSWTITITEVASGTLVSSITVESDDGRRVVDPWPSHAPNFGEFLIAVRGPLGRGLSARAALAIDAQVTSTSQFRMMNLSGTGLEPAVATITLGGVDVPSIVELSAIATSAGLRLDDGSGHLDVVVSIPFMAVELLGNRTAAPTIAPQQIDLEDLAAAQLRVSMPSEQVGELYFEHSGEVLQTVRAGGSSRSAVFNLQQVVDTLAGRGSAQVKLRIDGCSIPVGMIRPRKLAQALSIDSDGFLEIVGASTTVNLSCAIYPQFAPWLPPYLILLSGSRSTDRLSGRLLGEGEVTAVLRVEDPWTPAPWAALPEPGNPNAFELTVGEISEDPIDPDRGFRSWLARSGPCLVSAQTLPRALEIDALLRRIRPAAPREVMRRELAGAIRPYREHVVEAVLRTETEARDLMRLFIESDVVTVPGESWASSPLLWTYSVGLGVLADSDQMLTDEKPLFLNSLESYVGKSAVEIVTDGLDPLGPVGRFNAETKIMSTFPQDRIDELWSVANPLPGHFLDKDPRASAAKELFDERSNRHVQDISRETQAHLTAIKGVLVAELGPFAFAPIEARLFQSGWMNLPALSLAFGMCARHAAAGSEAAMVIFRRTRLHYSELAHAAPAIVEKDLALGELWLTHWRLQ